jgi:hypothetical protein
MSYTQTASRLYYLTRLKRLPLKLSATYYSSFILQATYFSCALYYKSCTIVIYYSNDNGLYYKTTIQANSALARSISYDRMVRSKLKRTLQLYLYVRKTVIVEATEH